MGGFAVASVTVEHPHGWLQTAGPPDEIPDRHPGWGMFGVLAILSGELAVHSARGTLLAQHLAGFTDLPMQQHDFWGCLLHDVGTIDVPTRILQTPGPLTPAQHGVVATHAIRSACMLEEVKGLRPAAAVALHHHERWDGQGYPHGLTGPDIPAVSRVLSVCDTFCALTAPRPHRQARPVEEALGVIAAEAGLQLDPVFAEAFIEMWTALDLGSLDAPAPVPAGLHPVSARAADLSRGQLEALFACALELGPEQAADRCGRSTGTQRNWTASLRRALACPARQPLPRFLTDIGRTVYSSVADGR